MRTQIASKLFEHIKEFIDTRNEYGFEKYKVTLDDVPFENYDWNLMALEEFGDLAQYLIVENQRLNHMLMQRNNNLEMSLNMFQEKSKRTMPKESKFDGTDIGWNLMDKSNFALGLNGESGELGDLVKKNVHHGHHFNRPKFVEEAGDVLFYLAGLCTMYGVTLEEVGIMNLHKLNKRYEKGFNKEDSIRRVDVNEK